MAILQYFGGIVTTGAVHSIYWYALPDELRDAAEVLGKFISDFLFG